MKFCYQLIKTMTKFERKTRHWLLNRVWMEVKWNRISLMWLALPTFPCKVQFLCWIPWSWNNYFIYHACAVKVAGYFLVLLWKLTKSHCTKNKCKNKKNNKIIIITWQISSSIFSQCMSRWYSTNPAIWLVPRAGSILPIRPTHSGSGSFSQPFVRF